MPEKPTYRDLEQQVNSLQSEILDLREIAAKFDDISEIKKTAMELCESEAYNKVLFQGSQIPLVVIDSVTGRFTDCNPAAVSIYAYNSREEVIGKSPLDVSAPFQYDGTGSEEAVHYHIKIAAKLGAHRFEWRHQRPDGSQWDAEVYLMAFTVKKRQMLKFSLQDITERKLTESALKDSKKELNDIINFLPDPTWVIDYDGKILFWNKAAEDYTGIKKEDMIGKGDYEHAIPFYGERRPTLANLILKPDEEWEKKYLRIQMEESTDKIKVGESYHPIMGESGRYLSATASKMYDSKGNVIGAIQSIRDITKEKIAEQVLERANMLLQQQAERDGLTGIPNRRKFDAIIDTEWQRMKRENKLLGLILCDIDCFKQFNDYYGHLKGDDCLRDVAKALSSNVHRPADLVARYGGEEFVVLLPDTSIEGCMSLAEKMRISIENLKIEHLKSIVTPILTMSFGVSAIHPKGNPNPASLLGPADNALYKAKGIGRNVVCH